MINCADCPDRKETDAVEQLEGAPQWVCTKKHTETSSSVCLMRMMIWLLADMLKTVEDYTSQ